MELIDEFIRRYTREQDYYEQVGRLAARTLELRLQEAGIRAIVTHRAKSVNRLREKCLKRNARTQYASIEQIYNDIVDLVGVRVALYFPGERDQVDTTIRQIFDLVEPRREFPDVDAVRTGKKFSGYSALHYRVQLRSTELAEAEDRYSLAKIEIQVASVLMHAWSEVEHDLVYKPLSGTTLSKDELALLDQLNGLVLAGEIALERLQEAGRRRVRSDGEFANHYDLANFLVGQAGRIRDEPITDAGLGRVDVLFRFLERIERTAPDQLRPYLESLHDDFEMRPLAEQLVDSILNEAPDLYDVFREVRQEMAGGREGGFADQHLELGEFISQWRDLEVVLHKATPEIEPRFSVPQRLRLALSQGLIDEETVSRIDSLRRLRNNAVHGVDNSHPATLRRATASLAAIVGDIRRRLRQQ